jgi:hypothetical protein
MNAQQLAAEIADLKKRIKELEGREDPEYSTGTWTPAFQGSGTAGTFTYDTGLTGGEYTRSGNRVFFNGRIRITAIGTAPTGDLRITGLPIAAASPAFGVAGGAALTIWHGLTLPANYTQVMLRITNGTTYLNLTRGGSNQSQANVQGGELVLVTSVANFDFEGHYRI